MGKPTIITRPVLLMAAFLLASVLVPDYVHCAEAERVEMSEQAFVLLWGRERVQAVQELVGTVLEEYGRDRPQRQMARVRDALDRALSQDRLKRALVKFLRPGLKQDSFINADKYLSSTNGRRLTKAELTIFSRKEAEAIKVFGARMPPEDKTGPRWSLVEKLEEAYDVTGNLVDMVNAVGKCVSVSINYSLPERERADTGSIVDYYKRVAGEMKEESRRDVTVGLYFALRGIDDASVEEYAQFAGTPDGYLLRSQFDTALVQAIDECCKMVDVIADEEESGVERIRAARPQNKGTRRVRGR